MDLHVQMEMDGSVTRGASLFSDYQNLMRIWTHPWVLRLDEIRQEKRVSAVCVTSGAKTIKKNTNSTQNKSQTHRAKQYEVTSLLSTDYELSTETCSKNVYSLSPWRQLRNVIAA